MKDQASFIISGTGCALVDYLYTPIDFNDPKVQEFFSRKAGDGGLEPGKLTLTSDFEAFSEADYMIVRNTITENQEPTAINIGGPSIVSLIHASQMLYDLPVEVSFTGARGVDEGGDFLESRLADTPVKIRNLRPCNSYTPFTDVLSDPNYNSGHGERIFINNIGAAGELEPDDLDEDFFSSQIVVFGGTALVPKIHSKLEFLLAKAKRSGAFTIVNTVYDFLSEKADPHKPWPMGNSIDTYHYIDLLITDMEEALRLSGAETAEDALKFFMYAGTGAVIITHDSHPIHFFSRQSSLIDLPESTLPVSEKIKKELAAEAIVAGDTTGCGDNFVGGVIASLARQMIEAPDTRIDLKKAIALGTASGGFACFYHGGTYHEEKPGQKSGKVNEYYLDYLQQTGLS